MNTVTRYLTVVLALGFGLAGFIVFLQTVTGQRAESYVFPCALMAGGLFGGWLAWNFGSGVDTEDTCVAEGHDGDSHPGVEMEVDDAA